MKCRKLIAGLLLLALFPPYCLFSQEASAGISSVQRIREIVTELEAIQIEKDNYLTELDNTNEVRRIELYERMNELAQREQELKGLKTQLELFGNLIDDQAAYYKISQRKLTFWRITSGVLATSLATVLVMWGVSR